MLNTQRALARNESIDYKSSTNELITSRNFDASPLRTYGAQQNPFEAKLEQSPRTSDQNYSPNRRLKPPTNQRKYISQQFTAGEFVKMNLEMDPEFNNKLSYKLPVNYPLQYNRIAGAAKFPKDKDKFSYLGIIEALSKSRISPNHYKINDPEGF